MSPRAKTRSKSKSKSKTPRTKIEQLDLTKDEIDELNILLEHADEIRDKDHLDFDKYFLGEVPKDIFLTVRDLKYLRKHPNRSIRVVEPQLYNKVTQLNNQSQMLEDSTKELGYFYIIPEVDNKIPKNDEIVYSGGGADVWVKANKVFLSFVKDWINKHENSETGDSQDEDSEEPTTQDSHSEDDTKNDVYNLTKRETCLADCMKSSDNDACSRTCKESDTMTPGVSFFSPWIKRLMNK